MKRRHWLLASGMAIAATGCRSPNNDAKTPEPGPAHAPATASANVGTVPTAPGPMSRVPPPPARRLFVLSEQVCVRSDTGWDCRKKDESRGVKPPTPEARFVEVASAGLATLGRTSNGRVFFWGEGSHGFSGSGETDDVATPTEVPDLESVDQLRAAGRAYALQSDGRLQRWGTIVGIDCFQPQLVTAEGCPSRPRLVQSLENVVVLVVARSEYDDDAACALLGDGTVSCWGDACRSGRCGTDCERERDPTPVHGIENAIGVTVGPAHACAWDSEGAVYCWGETSLATIGSHRLPDPPPDCWKASSWTPGTPPPVVLTALRVQLPAARWVDAGKDSTCAIDLEGKARCWGRPNSRARTIDADATFLEVVHDPDPSERTVWALDGSGAIWCWAGNCGPTPRRLANSGK